MQALGSRRRCGTRPRCRSLSRSRTRPGRCCCRCGRRRRSRYTRTHRAVKDFHRSDYVQGTVVAACFPDVISTISVGCEVTPSNCEWNTHRPRITGWIEDLHLISGNVKIPTQDIHQATEVHRSGVACGVGYVRKRVNGISHRVIHKCVVRVGENPACDISAATCVDETTDGGGWQIAQRNWQDSTLLHPAHRIRRKLPNLTDPNAIRNVEATQSDERVVEHSEATGQNAGCPGRPVSTNNSGDTIADGEIGRAHV